MRHGLDETTALLTGDRERDVAHSRPSARWIIIPCFISSLLGGAAASVEMEIYSQTACRGVAARDGVLHLLGGLIEGGTGWTEMCRSDPAVQRETTRIITSILLVAGALSALTAAWWGALADRKGRKVVLLASTIAELVEAGIMVLYAPDRFGYGALLLLAAFAGLLGGQLANMAVASAYLGDIAGAASKAQLLSSYEAALFAGLGLGPLLGSALVRYASLGPRTPYILMLVFNAAYLSAFPFMPESLPPSRRAQAAARSSQAGTLAQRVLAIPASLVSPFRVLVPRRVDEGKRKDGRLLLVAISGALLLVDTGLGPVEVLYARAKYSWGPQDTGHWLSYTYATKLVILVGVVPLVRRWFKPAAPATTAARACAVASDVENDACTASPAGVELANETQKRKSVVELRYDVRLACWTMSLAVAGYLVMLLPSPSVRHFLVTSGIVSIAAAAPPALQSLALSLAGPEDAAKVLACVSALATVSTATLGPTVFGTAYVASVEWWPEMIFGLAALWMAAAVVPLLFLRFGSPREDEERGVEEEARA
ncbi:uncharacterized protein RHOBADRAFT_43224 [Rhodotorula graminis WP1]|uniref:Major facilitator superfamily (MFS) profile domain-containing protein n=1 Tax=Rhodotorula graminis (strain WP1) TaxID=578459 RepID=A0A194S5L5_RHOGW|nr:uncharacterized protein RHOBADRAFT_43224 [Rhodotorula graminis WP1]KPV75800.1 hypothetical protein RHOBADRAFT_43224 [Rhodotorula graminis WP1]